MNPCLERLNRDPRLANLPVPVLARALGTKLKETRRAVKRFDDDRKQEDLVRRGAKLTS